MAEKYLEGSASLMKNYIAPQRVEVNGFQKLRGDREQTVHHSN